MTNLNDDSAGVEDIVNLALYKRLALAAISSLYFVEYPFYYVISSGFKKLWNKLDSEIDTSWIPKSQKNMRDIITNSFKSAYTGNKKYIQDLVDI